MGVFAFNDLMALGVQDAAHLSHLDTMSIVGFDASEYGISAVKEGRIAATVTQSPYDMGKIGVEQATALASGEKVPPSIFTRTELVTKEQLEHPFR